MDIIKKVQYKTNNKIEKLSINIKLQKWNFQVNF